MVVLGFGGWGGGGGEGSVGSVVFVFVLINWFGVVCLFSCGFVCCFVGLCGVVGLCFWV